MFTLSPYIGVGIALLFMASTLYAALKYTKSFGTEDKLEFLMVYIVITMCNMWFIDNIIAFKIELLDKTENTAILQVLLSIATFSLGSLNEKRKKKDAS